MSIIAQSLKKIKNRDLSNKNIELSLIQALPNFGYISLFIILIFSFLIFAGDYYYFMKKIKKSEFKFKIKNLETTFYNYANNFTSSETHKNFSSYLKYLLITEKYNEFNKILNSIKRKQPEIYLKFSGILYYKEKKYDLSLKKLQQYLKKYGNDPEVLSYISNIYYFNHEYKKALELYNRIDIQNFEIFLNKAIIFEKLRNFKKSLEFYKKSYTIAKDPLIKRRILNKIFLLKRYEQ